MDDTQFFLLNLAGILGVFLAVSSFMGIILALIHYFSNRKIRYLAGIILHSFFSFFGAVFAYAASIIVIISGGMAG